jgi:hypothetical protein
VPHDEHFLERLDRISDSCEELELALGLTARALRVGGCGLAAEG